MNGDIDIMNRVERVIAARLSAVSGVSVVVQNEYKHYTLPMRADTFLSNVDGLEIWSNEYFHQLVNKVSD